MSNLSPTLDMKLEVVVIPVSDVDRAKRFYGQLGWRLDADFVVGDAFRVVQFTPPGRPPRFTSARDSRPPRRARPSASS
jgi:catechol 2,3-dioxygenase-like lactoylglutathione lyase family enzyme